MLRLLLVRHGQTAWNAQRRYQGHTDLPLNDTGLAQARQLAARLQTQKIDLLISSDLQRAVQTARILAEGRDLPHQTDPRLREINFGVLEGHTFDEGLALWPEVIRQWVEDNNQPPQGGERMDELTGRVLQSYTEVLQSCDGRTVLLVAHGGPLRVILQHALGVSPLVWFNLEHASLSELQIDPANIILNRLNDTGSVYT